MIKNKHKNRTNARVGRSWPNERALKKRRQLPNNFIMGMTHQNPELHSK
ncbi:hypothetical protein [Costertonia aggregata]|uniref:Uncharacterized protein n=1 Tax=Costertonia aggregata TaxID=343403 RepID=A0A7H9ANM8_9FLAO|nr:hypothetical protein [Costertonia aggregata]QLG44983.1 hypothetical protein HYG79_06330 [Costertonia aggregata]